MNIIYRILILRCQEIINMPIKIDSLDYQTWVFLLKSLQKKCVICACMYYVRHALRCENNKLIIQKQI